MTRIVIERNLLPQLLSALPSLVQDRTETAVEGGREAARGALTGGTGIENESSALSRGMVVSTPDGNDEAERRSEARSAFVGGRQSDKAGAQFEQLCGHALALAQAGQHEALAALSVLMAYGAMWEDGFDDRNGKRQQAPWFAAAIYGWATNGLGNAYAGVVAEALR